MAGIGLPNEYIRCTISKPNKRLPMTCVGCHTRHPDCRLTLAGPTCPACRVELERVMRWAFEVRKREPEPVRVGYRGHRHKQRG